MISHILCGAFFYFLPTHGFYVDRSVVPRPFRLLPLGATATRPEVYRPEEDEHDEEEEDDERAWGPPRVVSSLKSAEADPSRVSEAEAFAATFFDDDDRPAPADGYDFSWDGPLPADYDRPRAVPPPPPEAALAIKDLSVPCPPSPPADLPLDRGREAGYMGDCTLEDIAEDYGAPLCYLLDVLTDWGVPPPILPASRLGDLVTGEQAYAVVEAVHSLDMHELAARYESVPLARMAKLYDVPVRDAFEFCMREGYNLPQGVHTVLRTVQAQAMLEALYEGEEEAPLEETRFGPLAGGDEESFIDFQDFRVEEMQ